MRPLPVAPTPARSLVRVALPLALALLLATPALAATPDWAKAAPVTVVDGLDMPVDIEVAPDGTLWYIELKGNVSSYDPVGKAKALEHHVDNVIVGGERGLVGMALAHDFADSGAFYLYYTERNDDPAGGINRLVRVEDGKQTLLLSVPGAKEHNGGRIAIAPDGTMYVGTGENQLRDPAQDLDSPLGKILRMTPDGKPVEGNLRGLVYAYGIRNPYGLALHPDTGELWETENSGWRRDEVNIIKPGANYGYPECEGFGLNGVSTPCPTNKGYTFPLRTFYENDAVAPTGATFWRGEFYWASLNEGSIHHTWLDPATQQWQDQKVFSNDGMPIFDLAVGPDDALYVATYDSILKIALPDEDLGNIVTPESKPGPSQSPPGAGATGSANQVGGGQQQGGGGLVRPDDAAGASEGAPGLPMVVVLAALALGLALRRRT